MLDDPAYPYVARHRRFEEIDFDFLIADEEAASWYGSPNQVMPERQWCRAHIRRGDVIVDCGAHHGMMTVLFALWTGPSGRVISYEALPWNAEVARQNVKMNGLANVEVRAVGVGDSAKRITASNSTNNVVVAQAGLVSSKGSESVDVQLVRLDDDLGRGFEADFLKVDVEGSDLQALRGARHLLRSRPIVDLELHNFLFEDPTKTLADIFRILKPRWYRYEILPEIFSQEWVYVDRGTPDLKWLARQYNPHVGCVPRGWSLTDP